MEFTRGLIIVDFIIVAGAVALGNISHLVAEEFGTKEPSCCEFTRTGHHRKLDAMSLFPALE